MCHFFFFFKKKTCNLYSDAESNCHKWKQRIEGLRSPPSPSALTTLTDDCQNILASTHKNATHRAKSRERESDYKKELWWESQFMGLLRLISLILRAFLGIFLSHGQPRAAGQGAGLWANATLQGPIEELVKWSHSAWKQDITDISTTPLHASPQANFSSPESTIFFNTSREIVLGIKGSTRHQWGLGTRQTEVCVAMGNRRICHS